MVEKAKKEKRNKILVTGSSGMLGTCLCRELSSAYEAIGLDIIQSTVHGPPSRDYIPCNITDRKKTMEAILGAKPDLIIHAAAWTDVDACEREPDKAKRINEGGTDNVASAAAESNIPLIYISTDFVFDGRKKKPYTEEDTPNPLNAYARSKLKGEKKVSRLNKYLILRTGWLFGSNGDNFVDTMLDMAEKEESLKIVDDQIGCPTYARDFVKAIGTLLYRFGFSIQPVPCGDRLNGKSETVQEIYHISNKGEVSWFDYAVEILKLAKITAKIQPIKSTELKRPAKRPAYSVLDNSKFENKTGFIMQPWQEALEEYINEK